MGNRDRDRLWGSQKLSEAAEASGMDLQAERDAILDAMFSVSDQWARSRESLVV